MLGRLAVLLLLVACAGCPGSGNGSGKKPDPAAGRTVTLFALAEMRGQIEPCGCTTDPLGDLARTARVIADAREAGPVVVVDAGSLLYGHSPVPLHLEAQEGLKSELLVSAYTEELKVAAIGVGPMDLAKGPEAVRPPRHAANVAGQIQLEPPEVIDAGGVRVGIFGVVSPEMAPGLEVGDPAAAAKTAVGGLTGEKVDVVVALLSMSKKEALALLRAVDGIDVAILGMGKAQPEPDKVDPRPEEVDGAWLIVPANRGQVISRIDVTVRDGEGPLVDAVGKGAAEAIGAELEARIASLDAELATFARDPDADQDFVARKQAERDELAAERARLAEQPLQAPAKGSYFTLEQIRIAKGLACDPEVQAAKTAYSKAAGEANVAAAAGKAAAPPAPGKPGYVGMKKCAECHEEAVAFWEQTRHAGAWETLETIDKQFDYDCITCHVTGWNQAGGATLGVNEHLRDVQCETCHGPGSLHAASEDTDQIQLAPEADLCATRCHTAEHSDTFAPEAYLRDVVGPGHGEDRRAALGDGPTGRQLRAAGLEKAGKVLGEGCLK